MTISEEDTLVFKIQGVQPGIQIYSKWYTLSSPSPNLSLKVQLLKKKKEKMQLSSVCTPRIFGNTAKAIFMHYIKVSNLKTLPLGLHFIH